MFLVESRVSTILSKHWLELGLMPKSVCSSNFIDINRRASASSIDANMQMEVQKCLSLFMFVELLERTCALRNATDDVDMSF